MDNIVLKVLGTAQDGGYISVGTAGVDENSFISVVKTTNEGRFQ